MGSSASTFDQLCCEDSASGDLKHMIGSHASAGRKDRNKSMVPTDKIEVFQMCMKDRIDRWPPWEVSEFRIYYHEVSSTVSFPCVQLVAIGILPDPVMFHFDL